MVKKIEVQSQATLECEQDSAKKVIGETLYRCYYEWKAYDDVFLSFPEQDYFNKKIPRLGLEALTDDQRAMSEAQGYIVRNKQEMNYINDMMDSPNHDRLTPFQLNLYLEYKKYQRLSSEQRRALEHRIKQEGIARLPAEEKELYEKYAINKYRRQWFTSFLPSVLMAVHFGYFDEKRGIRLRKAALEIEKRVLRQSLNTPFDIEQGDALIVIALRNIFPQLRGIDQKNWQHALQHILGIPQANHRPTPS
ncbi:MAG: hypothetical protein AAB400_01000 [Patescibacteria group bacterium]